MQKVMLLGACVCSLFLGVFCLDGAGQVPSAEAYKFLRKGENFREMAWNRTKFPVAVVLDNNGSPDLPLASIESVIKLSVGTWNAVDCTAARLKYSGVVRGKQAPLADNVNVIKFVQSANDWSRDWSAAQFAVTVVRAIIRTGEITDADMLLNDWNFKFGTNSVPKEADLQATITHELGHVLGIGHSLDTGASMAATANVGETNKRKLNGDDRNAICDLYPVQPCKEGEENGDKVCYNGRMYSICAPYQQACVPCNFDEDCHGAQNFCLNTNFGKLCGVACGPNLPACESGYNCEPVTANNQLIGRNCAPTVECSTLQKYPCCRNDDDCMPTYSCKLGSCVRGNVCRQLADTCSEQQACCPGMECVNDGTGPRCRKPCNPLAPQCDRGTLCALAENNKGYCVPPNGGGQNGAACDDTSKRCEYELYCDPNASLCRYLCNPAAANTCPLGHKCVALGQTGFGLCQPGGRDCKLSADCPQGQVCQNNLCRNCNSDSECPARYKCQDGQCRGPCTANSDCPRQQYCDNGVCKPGVPCTKDSDCSGGFICTSGICTPPASGTCKSDADCGNNKVCVNGVCETPDTCNNKCSADEVCRSSLCQPKTCVSDGQCRGNYKCVNSECVPDDTADCGGKGPCPQGKECYNNLCVSQLGSACIGDEDCLAGLTCAQGVNTKRCVKPCAAPSDCPVMFNNQATSCIKLAGVGMGCWPNSELECANGECKLKGSGCGGCSAQGEPPQPTGGLVLLLLFFGWIVMRRRYAPLPAHSRGQ